MTKFHLFLQTFGKIQAVGIHDVVMFSSTSFICVSNCRWQYVLYYDYVSCYWSQCSFFLLSVLVNLLVCTKIFFRSGTDLSLLFLLGRPLKKLKAATFQIRSGCNLAGLFGIDWWSKIFDVKISRW